MKTPELQEVMSWLKTTDLVEVSYREGPEGFALTSSEKPPEPRYPVPASRYEPVCAPAVGMFQWSRPGEPRKAEEGALVREGDVLGVVETGPGKSALVASPRAGRIARVFVEGGSAVEYGRLLFFLEPS